MEISVIKAALISMLLLFLCQITAAQDSPTDLAQQANTLYTQGDYAAAQSLYNALVAGGIRDSAVYYNLGQAYFAMQDSGQALLMYRRAQQLAPRDTDLNMALARIRASRLDIQGDDAALVDSMAALTMPLLTSDELNWLMFGVWSACFVAAGIYVLHLKWRNPLRALLFVLGLLLIFGFALGFSRVYTNVFRPAAVVTAAVAPVMSGPDEDYLQIYELHAAAELRVLKERGDWAHFDLPEGREGWIQLAMIEKI